MIDTDSEPGPAATVAAWQDALNARDQAKVLSLSSEQIEIIGPRGSAHGLEVLRGWLEGTHVRLEPIRTFAREHRVVVAQHGVWSDPVTREAIGESEVASVFEVEEGRVTRYARFDTLEEALARAGLSLPDELRT